MVLNWCIRYAFIPMAKIVVTGGAGFIGSHLTDRLVKDGHEVIVIDNLSTGRKEFINKKAKFYNIDLANTVASTLAKSLGRVDYIFHQAALPRIQLSLDEPIETFNSNVVATANMLEAARLLGVKRFIYASSSSIYGAIPDHDLPINEFMPCDPITPYAMHKYIGELLCKSYAENFKMDIVALRYFNVYGKRASTTGAYKLVMAIFREQKEKGEPLTIYGDGYQTRDFTYIDDVVNANILAMVQPRANGFNSYNICSGDEVNILDIAKEFSKNVIFVKNPRPYEEWRKVGSYMRAKSILGYKPTVFYKEGIRRYLI